MALDYDIKLNNFEGPLDLLLHLIQKEQVDIHDIFISGITGQYLEYMSQLDMLDMDKASEFLQVAATLLLIKSRSLLPKPPKILEDEEEEDPEQALIRQLKEYRFFKEAGNQLKELIEDNMGVYYKLPEELFSGDNIVLTGVNADSLARAFAEMMERIKAKEEIARPREISASVFSVKDRIIHIQKMLKKKARTPFSSIFSEQPTSEEVVVTFIALLDLIKNNMVKAEQEKMFGEIFLTNAKEKV